MNRFALAGVRAACAVATLALLAACAGPREATDWNLVSVQDQHRFLPQLLQDQMRPTTVVTAGPNGMVVAGGPAPAAHAVVQDGQVRLVSRETFAQMQQQPGGSGAMGASPTPPQAQPSR